MRITALIFLLAANLACAERLVYTPTAQRILSNALRVQGFFTDGSLNNRRTYVGFSYLKTFDIDLVEERRTGNRSTTTFDLAANYVLPFPDVSPGISLGVLDALNKTREGRSLYGVVTWRINNFDPVNAETPIDLSIGAGTGLFRGIFVNARIPFTNSTRLVVEHDTRRITAGLEVVIAKSDVKTYWLIRDQEFQIGVSSLFRF